MAYSARSANDPPPVKEAMGENGHLLNCHFIGVASLESWLEKTGLIYAFKIISE